MLVQFDIVIDTMGLLDDKFPPTTYDCLFPGQAKAPSIISILVSRSSGASTVYRGVLITLSTLRTRHPAATAIPCISARDERQVGL